MLARGTRLLSPSPRPHVNYLQKQAKACPALCTKHPSPLAKSKAIGDAGHVKIHFTKLEGNRHHVLVTRPNMGDAALGPQPTDSVIPHDLVHAAVEDALGLGDGFWGAFARGATFGGFQPTDRGRHKASGAKVWSGSGVS